MVLGFRAVGGVGAFFETNADKLHMIMPSNHPEIPWTALLLGLWIPNIFYWGLNQFIVQRALGAKNLQEGQRGIMLAAAMIAPSLANPKFGGIFKYIQMFQGFISPGIVTVFLFGLTGQYRDLRAVALGVAERGFP